LNEYHLAQVNIARMRAPLEDPIMSDFVARLDEVNALADASPGFVWRFQGEQGNATYLRPYEDDRILFNMSVWDSVEALRAYVYRSGHAEVLKRRHEWFQKLAGPSAALWWVPAGHLPSVAEAKARLAYLESHGSTAFAFTFQAPHAPEAEAAEPWAVGGLTPCPS
jgi:uncharacterized protein DUF3291